jgi:hypothetical protein
MGLPPLISLGLLHGLAVALAPPGPGEMAQAQPMGPIPLECRVGQEPWQPCQMEVIELGRHWLLRVGLRRIDFRHDGTGAVQMRQGERWMVVAPRWGEDQSLCWESVCARGEIPLD